MAVSSIEPPLGASPAASLPPVRISRRALLQILTRIVLPTFAKGIFLRRRTIQGAAQRFGLDLKAVQLLQALRERYGARPLHLALPFRPHLLLLDPADAAAMLAASPDPYSPATWEKRKALDHFEPGNVLISEKRRRAELRPLHERALATGCPHHPLAERLTAVIEDEVHRLLPPRQPLSLGWTDLAPVWMRMVRRLVLGDRAAADAALTDQLLGLRARANWAFFARKDQRAREAWLAAVGAYLAAPDPDSLAECMGLTEDRDAPAQVAQWLFAFEPAGIATFRALALLGADPAFSAQLRAEARDLPLHRPFAHGAFMEALRLWPTTPVILREARRDSDLRGTRVKEGLGLIVYTPFFHRDDRRLENAHAFKPERWQQEEAMPAAGLLPFSFGPVICPAHRLVPFIATRFLAVLLANHTAKTRHPILVLNDLPGELDHYRLAIDLVPVDAAQNWKRER